MVGPVPGIIAHKLPMTVPRNIGANDFLRSAPLGQRSRARTPAPLRCTGRTLLTERMNSATPKKPSARAASSTPSARCGLPKVNLCTPVLRSIPTIPSNRPNVVIVMPFKADPLASVEPASRPRSISEHISAGPKSSATLTSNGAKKIIRMMPNDAPKKDAITVMPRAVPPLPCNVIG